MKLIAPLFDLSFSEFITTRVVRVLYGLALVFFALASLIGFVLMFFGADGFFAKLGALIFGLPLVALFFFVSIALTRIAYEIVIVLFRIAENVQTIARTEPRSEQIGASPRF
jgi:hypothetical protein